MSVSVPAGYRHACARAARETPRAPAHRTNIFHVVNTLYMLLYTHYIYRTECYIVFVGNCRAFFVVIVAPRSC